jgi:Ion channel
VGFPGLERREELLLSLMLALIVLVFSAATTYVLEGEDDPQAFGSISRALWWSVCTLTIVGYGDIYPHSVLGKICGGITAFAGIGLIAMPTGILAAAFGDAFQRSPNAPRARWILAGRSRRNSGSRRASRSKNVYATRIGPTPTPTSPSPPSPASRAEIVPLAAPGASKRRQNTVTELKY